MVKKILKSLGEYLLKIFIIWAFIFVTKNGYVGEFEEVIYNFFRLIFLCILVYGFFIYDIIYKRKEKNKRT